MSAFSGSSGNIGQGYRGDSRDMARSHKPSLPSSILGPASKGNTDLLQTRAEAELASRIGRRASPAINKGTGILAILGKPRVGTVLNSTVETQERT